MRPVQNEKRYSELAEKWLLGTISEAEMDEFSRWYNTEQDSPMFHDSKTLATEEEHQQALLKNINLRIKKTAPKKISVYLWPSVAAAMLLILGIGFNLNFKNQHQKATTITQVIPKEVTIIKPGKNQAILTLSTGKKLILNTQKQLDVEELVSNDVNGVTELAYNIIETPKGGAYELLLPDGTKVWLNSATQLKFPTAFDRKERRVELVGEAYFEVAKDKSRLFKVITAKQEIDVLGTHFNINAYADDQAMTTTLLEGKVRINQSTYLKPGEQAFQNEAGLIVSMVDVGNAVAWKNGYFEFNENLHAIMKKLERWYNIDVRYETTSSADLIFAGKISRSKNIEAVLNIIEATGNVHFKIEGRRVIVMK